MFILGLWPPIRSPIISIWTFSLQDLALSYELAEWFWRDVSYWAISLTFYNDNGLLTEADESVSLQYMHHYCWTCRMIVPSNLTTSILNLLPWEDPGRVCVCVCVCVSMSADVHIAVCLCVRIGSLQMSWIRMLIEIRDTLNGFSRIICLCCLAECTSCGRSSSRLGERKKKKGGKKIENEKR